MKHFIAALVLGLGLTTVLGLTPVLGSSLKAEQPAAKSVVVELFTSQSCYSCPPAESYLGDLAQNPEIIALEFHVDYWDDLVYGRAGKWKDVFSKPEFTQRQRIYAGNLRKGQVYTPQMVVGGLSFAVGSNRRAVKQLIAKAKEFNKRVGVSVARHAKAGMVAQISGSSDRALSVWLVRFLKNVTTRVRAGENKGKELTSHNIVTKVERLADWSGKPSRFNFAADGLKPGEGCAVLLQEAAQGPIYGAALCPVIRQNG